MEGRAPLVEALFAAAERRPAVFHTPGHKRGSWVSLAGGMPRDGFPWAWDGGDAVWDPAADHDLSGVARAAAVQAARVWGSAATWFLWNGATAGVLAAVLAVARPGMRLLLPRLHAHRSLIDAMVLAGAEPAFVASGWLEGWDLPLPPAPDRFASALRQGGPVAGAVAVSPTYQGICAPLERLASTVHPQPLIVDEAHGAHLAFYPRPAPPSGLSSGAHLVVHGSHKTLPVLTQAAMLHWTGAAPAGPGMARVERFLEMVQSTSPQPALLASLDAARVELERFGHRRVARAVELARDARRAIASHTPLRCLSPEDLPDPYVLDETRLVVDVGPLEVAAGAAQRWLIEARGVWPEMASGHHLVFVLTGADDSGTVARLVDSLRDLGREVRAGALDSAAPSGLARRGETGWCAARWPTPGEQVLGVREAAMGETVMVPWEAAAGAVSASVVAPYPPGVALLVPGEKITGEVVECVRELLAQGGSLRGCPDGGRQVWVVA